MTIDIRSQRRQQFLTQDLYDSLLPYYQGHQVKLNELLAGPISDVGTRRRWSYFLSDGNYELLSLRYTAGEDLHALRAELPTVIEAYERLQRAIAAA
ncbi:hypothetical protein HNQ59_003988, partial [Chitinivorax tropicus]|nr:hypothetical protein [Chitinivorax tropicus]